MPGDPTPGPASHPLFGTTPSGVSPERGDRTLFITASAYASQPWVLQESSNLIDWISVSTNPSDATGLLQLSNKYTGSPAQEFFRLKSP